MRHVTTKNNILLSYVLCIYIVPIYNLLLDNMYFKNREIVISSLGRYT